MCWQKYYKLIIIIFPHIFWMKLIFHELLSCFTRKLWIIFLHIELLMTHEKATSVDINKIKKILQWKELYDRNKHNIMFFFFFGILSFINWCEFQRRHLVVLPHKLHFSTIVSRPAMTPRYIEIWPFEIHCLRHLHFVLS